MASHQHNHDITECPQEVSPCNYCIKPSSEQFEQAQSDGRAAAGDRGRQAAKALGNIVAKATTKVVVNDGIDAMKKINISKIIEKIATLWPFF